MKVDKRNPLHWLCLGLFSIQVALARLWRRARHHRASGRVVLYGHKLNGNLRAIHDYLLRHPDVGIEPIFLTMDRAYHRQLRGQGIASVLATSLDCARLLTRADAVISDHGLHVMKFMLGTRDLKFFDVWHGIPFKGFDADDFRLQHRYDEVWVASPLMARLYVERYGFDPAKVKVTGYARTDRLVVRDEDPGVLKKQLGLDGPGVGKIVLFAPTWKQDARKRSIFPFGLDEHTFLRELSALAQRCGATIVVRAHLNSAAKPAASYPRIVRRSHADYPDTEALLLVSDVLVCDWSSIAFDYLLLDRPTIFLDVEPPFSKGLSLGPECRYGPSVSTISDLLHFLDNYLQQSAEFDLAFGQNAADMQQDIYGEYANGTATASCVRCLVQRLELPRY